MGTPLAGSLNRAHDCPLATEPGYVVRSIVVPPCRRRTCAPPLGRELAGRFTWRYSVPEPKGPRTWVVKVKTVCHPPLRTWSRQLFREIEVASGFAISIHSGFDRGETSLTTALVAAWTEIGNRATAASGRAKSYSSRQSDA